ncbi:hypothetical protein A5886_000958 [Enterococcus sp. 8G7_MSG3316]|uniref:RNA polymerase sigma-70 region 2 domain-containing protein n=1 Tax=Candidatus Enterococcus testudinis TaxID=1834191 RepID=A0A242A4K3_9ENTE|nr:sigma-70 family RNA polymerase sigma factor [Enterococcus sp. 8G7_MSG3316]OTN75882.1 hypothetical protein A5886_000958 [Enterococcus sp. 8G7_MSG3316]
MDVERLIKQYEGLFYKVLVRAGIFRSHADYEDYLQEVRILFYQRAESYSDEASFRQDNEIGYLFSFLLWRVIDLQRKQTRQNKAMPILLEQVEPPLDEPHVAIENDLLFLQFWSYLSDKEQGMWVKCHSALESKQKRYYYRKKLQAAWERFVGDGRSG